MNVNKSSSKVFLVDDHPLVREWLTNLIDQHDDLSVCGEAKSVQQALDGIQETDPDVAIVVDAPAFNWRVAREMKKRGIRVVIGGDYGFARTPQGQNARDIAHFVRYLGYSPTEALVCATRYGAELMGMGHEAGQVREGFLADLLLVEGDPVADVNMLQNTDRLVAILKGGEPYKLDRAKLQLRQMRAAE